MGRRLKTFVTVGGTTYPPGEVSDEVAGQITNDAVFEAASEDEKPAKKAAAKRPSSK